MYAGFLWWLTWPPLLLRYCHGFPILGDAAVALSFCEEIEGYPFNLPRFLLGLSVVASVLSVIGVWISSRATCGKWRQRALAGFFAALCCGVAYLPFAWEPGFIESARAQRQFLIGHPVMIYPEGTPEEVRSREWRHLDEALIVPSGAGSGSRRRGLDTRAWVCDPGSGRMGGLPLVGRVASLTRRGPSENP